MVDWLLKGDETAADRLTVVAVENGTHVHGAAARVVAKLRESGFDAQSATVPTPKISSDDLPAHMEPPVPSGDNAVTRITYAKASVATRAQKIGQLLGIGAAQVTKEVRVDTTGSFRQTKEDRADVTVILGADIASTFAAPQQSARL